MNKKTWIQKDYDLMKIVQLANETTHSFPMATSLVNRKIYNKEDARQYLRPDISKLYNPYLMKGMKRAVARIKKAIQKGESVVVYGDYDV